MLVRDIDPDVAANLPPEFVNRFLSEINYCDQSESPPVKANQTHALLFGFNHRPPGSSGSRLYRGTLVYSPPLYSLQLGWFSGAGMLVGGGDAPFWVGISIAMRRSGSIDPATGFNRVSIGGSFTFRGARGAVGAPDNVVADYFQTDIDIVSGGEPHFIPFMQLRRSPEGHQGNIFYRMSTVVPA
jgi:hypothetical protein